MKISGKGNRANLTINGKRCGISIDVGPWIESVNPDTIKIYPKSSSFPREIADAFSVENNSDSREDYYESDSVRLLPGHPLYAAAKNAAAI
jgi:hypothetical protein